MRTLTTTISFETLYDFLEDIRLFEHEKKQKVVEVFLGVENFFKLQEMTIEKYGFNNKLEFECFNLYSFKVKIDDSLKSMVKYCYRNEEIFDL